MNINLFSQTRKAVIVRIQSIDNNNNNNIRSIVSSRSHSSSTNSTSSESKPRRNSTTSTSDQLLPPLPPPQQSLRYGTRNTTTNNASSTGADGVNVTMTKRRDDKGVDVDVHANMQTDTADNNTGDVVKNYTSLGVSNGINNNSSSKTFEHKDTDADVDKAICTPNITNEHYVDESHWDGILSFREIFRQTTSSLSLPASSRNTPSSEQRNSTNATDASQQLSFRQTKKKYAVCNFKMTGGAMMFAHGMQQIYRCVSYWLHRSSTTIITTDDNDDRDWVPVLMNYKYPKAHSPFYRGLIPALTDIYNLTLITSRNSDNATLVAEQLLSMSSSSLSSLDNHHVDIEIVTPITSESYRRNAGGGYAFLNTSHPRKLKSDILNYYNIQNDKNETPAGCRRSSPPADASDNNNQSFLPRVGIVNRQRSRHLLNYQQVIHALKEQFGPSLDVEHVYFEGISFEEQIKWMSQFDVLISPHGAQLTSLTFMPECGRIVELYTAGYYMPYYYGSLANARGIAMTSLYTGVNKSAELEFSKSNIHHRKTARARSLCVEIDKLIETVQFLIDGWRTCCTNGQTTFAAGTTSATTQ